MFKLECLFNKDFLLNSINNCEGLVDIYEEDGYIGCIHEDTDTELNFHYNVNYDELFDFASLKVDKEKFFNIVKNNLDKELFLMPRKIHFVSSEEEFEQVCDVYFKDFDFDNYLGMTWVEDSVAIINVDLCRKRVSGKSKKYKYNQQEQEDYFNEVIWTTLIHELRHIVCENAVGVIIPEEVIPISEGEEDNVEYYGLCSFEHLVFPYDHKCFVL